MPYMKLAVGYCRVSTIAQEAEGVSLDAQEAKIVAWATLHGFELLSIQQDAISGKTADKRPGLQTAVKQACQRKAALVVYSLSRLARSTKDAINISEQLERAHADLVSVTESIDTTTATGKMIFGILAVLAQFERDTISERTKAAMGYMRSQDQRISRLIPFGFNLAADRLKPNPGEQKVVGMMRQWRAKGHSLRGICGLLEKRHVANKTGGVRWSPSVVSGILARTQVNGATE